MKKSYSRLLPGLFLYLFVTVNAGSLAAQTPSIEFTWRIVWSPDGTKLAFEGRSGDVEIKSLPTANPGLNQTLTDTDNNGSELVTLDGTASIDSDGTIDSYEWLENGVVIAYGETPQVELEPGEHTITLKVTDNDGLVDMAEVVIMVEAAISEQLDDSQSIPTGVISVAWSPDGTMLVSGGTNGLLQVTDPTGNLILDISGLTGTIGSVAWNPDSNKFAATITDDMTVRVWNVNDPQYTPGALLATFTGHESFPTTVDWSPDGTRIVSVGINEFRQVKLWDAVTFQPTPVAEQATSRPFQVVWSPDSTRIAIACEAGVLVFEKSLNIIPYAIADNHRLGADFSAASVTWSPDGSTIAVGYDDHNIALLDVNTGATLATLQGHTDFVNALAWNPTGTQLASASQDGTIRVWDSASGTQLTQINKLSNALATNSIGWNPEGTAFAYGDEAVQPVIKALPIADAGPDQTLTDTDNDGTELVPLDATTSIDPDGTIDSYEWLENDVVIAEGVNPQVELEVGGHTITLKVTDNDGLVDMGDVIINVLDQNGSPRVERQFEDSAWYIAWHPNGQILAVTFDADISLTSKDDETTYILSRDGTIISQLNLPAEQSMIRLNWNADGNRLAALTYHSRLGSHHIFVWDTSVPGNPVLQTSFPDLHPTAQAIEWGNNDLIATNYYGNVEFWNVQTNSLASSITRATIEEDGMVDMAWNADGTRLVVADGENAYIWSTEGTPILLQTLSGESTSDVNLVWSPDGKQLAYHHSGTIEIWEFNPSTNSYVQITTLNENPRTVAIDWQGNYFAAIDSGVRVYIWDTQLWQLRTIVSLTTNSPVKRPLALSPDASHIAFAGNDNRLAILAFPIANPGPNQTLTDADNDGSELMTLDGTASIDPDGMIDTYEWLENGVVIAEGANPQVELTTGEHTITLKVTDNDGLVDMAEVVVEVVD